MNEILPWHQPILQRLQHHYANDRMPHAILLSGIAGIGKRILAEQLSHGLLCEAPPAFAQSCGTCKACQLLRSHAHPDFYYLATEEGSKEIKVDQVRNLIQRLSMKSQYGGYQVGVIYPAEALNSAASNSLLKTLEEPSGQTLLLLMSEQPSMLSATIRSRCQTFNLASPERSTAIAWLAEQRQVEVQDPGLLLALAQGAPLRALALADNTLLQARLDWFAAFEQVVLGKASPISIAEKWIKEDLAQSIYWVITWITDMIQLQMVGGEGSVLNSDLRPRLVNIAKQNKVTTMFKRLDQAKQARRLVRTSVNTQLLLEDLLITWAPQ